MEFAAVAVLVVALYVLSQPRKAKPGEVVSERQKRGARTNFMGLLFLVLVGWIFFTVYRGLKERVRFREQWPLDSTASNADTARTPSAILPRMLAGFRAPPWSELIDVEQRILRTPESATIRGLFLQMIVDSAKAARIELPGPVNYSTFVPYPMRDYMRLAVAAAERRFASEHLREGLRRVGHTVYPEFKQTMVGSAIFAFAGDDFKKVAGLAQKAYAVSLNPGAVSLRELAERHIVVELRDVYNFPDCLQIGVWEGALSACRAKGEVNVRAHTASDVDLEITWG